MVPKSANEPLPTSPNGVQKNRMPPTSAKRRVTGAPQDAICLRSSRPHGHIKVILEMMRCLQLGRVLVLPRTIDGCAHRGPAQRLGCEHLETQRDAHPQ